MKHWEDLLQRLREGRLLTTKERADLAGHVSESVIVENDSDALWRRTCGAYEPHDDKQTGLGGLASGGML